MSYRCKRKKEGNVYIVLLKKKKKRSVRQLLAGLQLTRGLTVHKIHGLGCTSILGSQFGKFSTSGENLPNCDPKKRKHLSHFLKRI